MECRRGRGGRFGDAGPAPVTRLQKRSGDGEQVSAPAGAKEAGAKSAPRSSSRHTDVADAPRGFSGTSGGQAIKASFGREASPLDAPFTVSDTVSARNSLDKAASEVARPGCSTVLASAEQIPRRARSASKRSDSRFLGVSRSEAHDHWLAELWDGNRFVPLGLFINEEEAALVYDKACVAMHGAAAIINFPAQAKRRGKHTVPALDINAGNALSAVEVLVSRSSAVEEEASHFEISPALTEAQETGSSPKRRFCTVGRETPDPMVASLHPTPSPYQDSNCEEQPSVEVQKVASRQEPAAGLTHRAATAAVPHASGLKAVRWHKVTGRWAAFGAQETRSRNLGYFDTQREADAEVLKRDGPSADVNFPAGIGFRAPTLLDGPAHATRSNAARLCAKEGILKEAANAQGHCIKWNPEDGRYHVYLWSEERSRLESEGSFASKAAAVRAIHSDTKTTGERQSDVASKAPAGIGQLSRCNSLAAGSAVLSGFSSPALQPSETVEGSHVAASSLETASSIQSPLRSALMSRESEAFIQGLLKSSEHPDMLDVQQQGPEGPGKHGLLEESLKPLTRSMALGKLHCNVSDASGLSVGGGCDAGASGSAVPAATHCTLQRGSIDGVPSSMTGSPPTPKAQPRATANRVRRTQMPPIGRATALAPAPRPPQRKSSRFKGVSWSERSSKWRAQMWYGNKVHHLGFFSEEDAAARCYDAAVLQLRGPTAPTNFAALPAGHPTPLKPSILDSIAAESVPKVTAKYRGVRWHYCNSKWEARIFDGSRQVSLGYFDDEAEAAAAYDRSARGIRGQAAIVNFPDPQPAAGSLVAAAAKPLSKRAMHSQTDAENLPDPPKWGSKKRRQ